MELQLRDHTEGKLQPSQERLAEKALAQAAERLDVPEQAEMSLTFVLNPEIRELNRDYRGIDRATDVISFAIEDDDDLANLPAEIRAELPVELGDLVISIDKVTEQALFLNHSADRELGYLLVHGFLHLNGYDHEEPADEEKMFTLQEEILDGLGQPVSKPKKTTPSPNHYAMLGRAFAKYLNKSATCVSTWWRPCSP